MSDHYNSDEEDNDSLRDQVNSQNEENNKKESDLDENEQNNSIDNSENDQINAEEQDGINDNQGIKEDDTNEEERSDRNDDIDIDKEVDDEEEEINADVNDDDKNNKQVPPFPLARVKRIIKLDPEVKMIQAQATQAFGYATKLFCQELGMKMGARLIREGKKTCKTDHLVQCCQQESELNFLLEDMIPFLQKSLNKPVIKPTKATVPQKELASNSLENFFQ
ncbi:hypothetical protein WA158_002865 [Blastocystis sp. Blastoise]